MMELENIIPIKPQDEINPEEPGDYYKDGLLVCGTCGKRKQLRIKFMDTERTVACICDCRKKEIEERDKRIEYEEEMIRIQRLKESSMMSGEFKDATFKTYQRREGNQAACNMAVSYCKQWRKMFRENQGILFYGPVGTGKSYTAACIANFLLEHQVPVVMTSFVKILQDIRSTMAEAEYIAILNAASLLIIDDLGAERGTDYAQEKVYNIIDSRMRANKPMILTTNLSLEEMIDCEDIRYKRTYDRILKNCCPVELTGTSMRMQEAASRFDSMKKMIMTGG